MTTLSDITRKFTILHETPGAQAAAAQIRSVANAAHEGAAAAADYARSSLGLDAAMQKSIAYARLMQKEANGVAASISSAAAASGGYQKLGEKVGLDVLQAGAATAGKNVVFLSEALRAASPVIVGTAGTFARTLAPALGIVAKEATATSIAVGRELLPVLGQVAAALAPVALPVAGVLAIGFAIYETLKGVKQAIKDFAEFEAQQAKLQSSLNVTGGIIGKTTAQIEEVVQSVGDIEHTREAAAALVKLRIALPDGAFGATLKSARDLSALGFGSVAEAAKGLAGALDDPVKSLDAMEKAGLRFGFAQKQVIKDLVDSGQAAEAYRRTLELVNDQAAGASAANQNTLKGAWGELSEQLKIGSEQMGEMIAAVLNLKGAVQAIASFLTWVNRFQFSSPEADLNRARLQTLIAANANGTLQDNGRLNNLDQRSQGENLTAAAGVPQLEQLVQDGERVFKVMEKLRGETFGFTEADLAGKTKEEVKALKEKAEAQKEINDLLREAHLLNALTTFGAGGAGDQGPTVGMIQAQQILNLLAIKKTLEAKPEKPEKDSADRWDTVTNAVNRHLAVMNADALAIGKGAAETERLRTEFKLLEALREGADDKDDFDKKIARYTELRGKMSAELALKGADIELDKDKAKQWEQLTKRADETYVAYSRLKIASDINFEKQTLFVTPDDLAIANKLKSIYGDDVPKSLASTEAAQLRVLQGMRELKDTTAEFTKDLLHGFVDGLKAGKNAWDSFSAAAVSALDKIATKLEDKAIDVLINAAFATAVGSTGGTSGAFASLFALGSKVKHTGGLVDVGGNMRWVHPASFDGAPHFSTGGIAGFGPDEVPIVAHKDEEILTRSDPRHRFNGGLAGAGGGVTFGDTIINVHGNADNAAIERISRELQASRQAQAAQHKAIASSVHAQKTGVMRAN